MMLLELLSVYYVCLCFVPLGAASDVLIPKPTGPYGTSINAYELIDNGRINPSFAPSNQTRKIMISIYQPVVQANCSYMLQNYLTPATAAYEDSNLYPAWRIPVVTFGSLKLQVCNQSTPGTQSFPLVLFSPALGFTRLFYGARAQSLASLGYTVVTIDHPYDTDIVEFPDGSNITGNLTDAAFYPLAVTTRVQDVRFVIDQLSNTTLLPSGFLQQNISMFGHSLGGATTASAIFADPRILGGLNLDGAFFGPVIQQGLSQPFLLFGASEHTYWNPIDPTWPDMWGNLTGWKVELNMATIRHYTFSDLPLVAKLLNLDAGGLPNGLMQYIGTLDMQRGFDVVQTYIAAFIGFVSTGTESLLLRMEDAAFPEIRFL